MAALQRPSPGGMAEWSIATVLKTVERELRGFESLSLRQKGGMALLISGSSCVRPYRFDVDRNKTNV